MTAGAIRGLLGLVGGVGVVVGGSAWWGVAYWLALAACFLLVWSGAPPPVVGRPRRLAVPDVIALGAAAAFVTPWNGPNLPVSPARIAGALACVAAAAGWRRWRPPRPSAG